MQITPHFTKEELEASRVASEEKIDNRIPDHMLPKAIRLCEHLEEVRKLLNQHYKEEVRMNISSGYRCHKLNSHPRVGGQKYSQHVELEAVDFTPSNTSAENAWFVIRDSKLPYDQLILETNRHGATWIHYSVAPENREPRRMAFRLQKKR